jgi:magnesium transporter
MHAVAQHVVDSYRDITTLIEADIDTVQDETFAAGRKTDIEQIYLLKREIVELRRAISPLSAALQRITTDHQDLVPAELMGYMRDVIDHQRDAADRISNYDDTMSSLVQAAVGKVGVQQNTDMRKIAAWVSMAAVITMVAGIYGMNFEHMPELRWVWAYPAVLAVMACICVFLYRTLRRNRWL